MSHLIDLDVAFYMHLIRQFDSALVKCDVQTGPVFYFHIVFFFSLLVVDCQLEILEFLVTYNDVIDRQIRGMLVLIGKSKLFLARLASQVASLVALCEILYSIHFRVNL